MGNAGGTGGNRQNAVTGFRTISRFPLTGCGRFRFVIFFFCLCVFTRSFSLCFARLFLLRSKPCSLRVINYFQKRFLGLCLQQSFHELRIHKQGGQSGKRLQMDIRSLCRRRDHKQDISQGTVKSLIIHALRHHHSRQTRLLYCLYLGMGNRDSAADPGASKSLPRQNSFLITSFVLQASACIHEIYQLINGFFLCGYGHIQSNAFLFQQFGNTHRFIPLFFIQLREQFHNLLPAADSVRKGSCSSAGRAKLQSITIVSRF